MASSSKLFTPLQLNGAVTLQHRLIMAPLTRFRADDAHAPLPFVADYYAQRASVPGTLLLTEATFISPRASGYRNVPGVWAPAQLAAWRRVTDAVHAKGSFIFCQLWALGRTANPEVLRAEVAPDAVVGGASDVPEAEGKTVPRPLAEDEIWEYVAEYAQAARNAVAAGFDGVEIHGANGYLVDQFLQDVSNVRTDAWGGSVEARARFGLEVAKAVVAAVGRERVGIRLSPWSRFQGMRMKDPVPQFSYFIKGLKELGLAYVHVVEGRVEGNMDTPCSDKIDWAADVWFEGGNSSPLFIAGGFKPESAIKSVDSDPAFKDRDVAVVFGRYFISNPDLPFRIKKGIELQKYNRDTFYIPKSEKGYIDYPFSKEWLAQESR